MRFFASRAQQADRVASGRAYLTCRVPAWRPAAPSCRRLAPQQVARPSHAAPEPGDDPAAISEPISRTQPAAEAAAAGDAPAPATAADTAAPASWIPADATAGGGAGSVPSAPAVAGSGGGGGVQGAAAAGGGGGGSQSAALLTRFNGVGYTFVLAGFLKIVTIGGLAASAPVDTARTAFGKASPYLMVPVGLGLCWLAKQVVDSGLNESRRFLRIMVGVLVLAYFGLTKLLFKYEPGGELVRRPRPRMPGPLAEVRADLGDKDLLAGAGSLSDSRAYGPEKPGRELYDDVAWYEGRYPSQLAAATAPGPRPGGRRAAERAYMSSRAAAAAASETDEDYAAAVDDILRARGAMDDARPQVSARRSFLSDSQR